ncbi:MAG: acetylxylan esterase [Pirellulaceae bacterium]|nr:acetylxylan esterase [Pirellulaceae bacterium]
MRVSHFSSLLLATWLLASCEPSSAQSQPSTSAHGLLKTDSASNIRPDQQVRQGLLAQTAEHFRRWSDDFEKRVTPQQIEEYQQRLRAEFILRIGGLPAMTPLEPVITGTVWRSGYRVEKLLFQSQPQFYVTAALFLPDSQRFAPPWPAVVILCGHSADGKLQDGYQRGAALAALNGLAALIVDPIGQGERLQLPDSSGKSLSPTVEHTVVGTAAIPLGWNTARWMIHDAMRSIDYLQSRQDILPERIGAMGNSGGGTQVSYLMALDPRVRAAAPSCYLTAVERLLETIGPQDAEQNIFGQIAIGLDHADYMMLRAPQPTLIACATRDFFDIGGTWSSYRQAKRLYERLGHGRHVELVEVEAEHGWHPQLRRTSVQFMLQHLAGRLGEIEDPQVQPLTAEEMQVTPAGQVLQIADARSVLDHMRDECQRLAALRTQQPLSTEALIDAARQRAGIRRLDLIPQPDVRWCAQATIDRFRDLPLSSHAELRPLILQTHDGIELPGVVARPLKASRTPADDADQSLHPVGLFLHSGFASALEPDGQVAQLVAQGRTVLALDVRGVGETTPGGKHWYSQRFGTSAGNAMIAYLLGQSLVGQRCEDCLVAARWLSGHTGGQPVDIIASGELTIPALHAAVVQPELIGNLEIRDGLKSWSELSRAPLLENQVSGVVHGALQEYDLPDLEAHLGARLVTPQ